MRLCVTDVVLSAHGGERTVRAAVDLDRRRRELAALDGVDSLHQPMLPLLEHGIELRVLRRKRDVATAPAEGKVRRSDRPPRAAPVALEARPRRRGVGGQLHDVLQVRRARELVVNHAERAVGHKIDAIRLGGKR
ncbi:MAG: hypothetical protein NTY02_01325 [Acidobacteria bacterium]|nr:hypothetical protein [Acidobacteriota bacterium]